MLRSNCDVIVIIFANLMHVISWNIYVKRSEIVLDKLKLLNLIEKK